MNKDTSVSQAIARIQAAHTQGRLTDYAPLAATGSEAVAATCAAAWGPAMRR